MTDAPLAVITASPATKSHRLTTALSTFGARTIAILLDHPDYTLPQAAYLALAGDPTLALAIDSLLQRGARGPKPAVEHPCTRLYYLAQGFPNTLHKENGTLHKVSPALPPTTTPDSVDSVLSPTGTALSQTNSGNGRVRNLHWDALTATVGEARTAPAKNRRGKAVHDLKEAGYSPEDIFQAAANWKQRMGDVLMTDMSMVSHIGQALGGPSLGSQKVHETAQIKHGRGLR